MVIFFPNTSVLPNDYYLIQKEVLNGIKMTYETAI